MVVAIPGDTKDLEFSVSDIKFLKVIPINDDIHNWLQHGRSGDIPQDSIQALDLILSQVLSFCIFIKSSTSTTVLRPSPPT